MNLAGFCVIVTDLELSGFSLISDLNEIRFGENLEKIKLRPIVT